MLVISQHNSKPDALINPKTVSAVRWTTAARVAQGIFEFAFAIILMRLLGPDAFGAFGMVLVFAGFLSFFSDMGFGAAVVQRLVIEERHRSTIFWCSLLMGGFMTSLLLASASLVASFYNDSHLEYFTRSIAFSFILTAPGTVPRALLQKRLRFDLLAKIDIAVLLCSGATAVFIAVIGGGVSSLVAQQLVAAVLASVLLFAFGAWRPRLMWSTMALRDLIGYAAALTAFNVVLYSARSADKLLIGKFLGSGALGLYSRAYHLTLLPVMEIATVLEPVMFPLLATIQMDKERVRRAFLRLLNVLTSITFPMMVGLVVVAEPFVLGVLGNQWASAIPVIQILSVIAVAQFICNLAGWIFISQGRTSTLFWWGLASSGILICSVVVGICLGGLTTVAYAYLLGNFVVMIPCLVIPGRLIGMTLRDVWGAVCGNLLCAIAMGSIVWSMGQLLPLSVAPLALLVVQVLVGAFVYVAISYFTRQPAAQEILQLCFKVAGADTPKSASSI